MKRYNPTPVIRRQPHTHNTPFSTPLTPSQRAQKEATDARNTEYAGAHKINSTFQRRFLILLAAVLLTTAWACWSAVMMDGMYQPRLASVVVMKNLVTFLPVCLTWAVVSGVFWQTLRAKRSHTLLYPRTRF